MVTLLNGPKARAKIINFLKVVDLSWLVAGSSILMNLQPELDVPKLVVRIEQEEHRLVTLENAFPTRERNIPLMIERGYIFDNNRLNYLDVVSIYGPKHPEFNSKVMELRRFGLA